jgi:RNA polymerase sigma factor (sigma-70 family)
VTDTRASAADLGFIPAAEAFAEDEQLVRLARAHDHATWATLFDRYYPVLCRYAYARLGSNTEAEDVASQTFLKAYEAIGRYEYRERPMLAWLYTICRNLATSVGVARGREPLPWHRRTRRQRRLPRPISPTAST